MTNDTTAEEQQWRVAVKNGLLGLAYGDRFYAADNVDGDLDMLVFRLNSLESDKATAVKALREARKAFRQIVQTEEAEGRERLRDIASHAGWQAQAALDAIEGGKG